MDQLQLGKRVAGSTIVALYICWLPSPVAAELNVELEAGIAHTNNINRAPDSILQPALEDTILSAGLELSYENRSAKSDIDIRGSIVHLDYQDGPYSSETLPALDASAVFRITDQSFSWFVLGNIGQQSVDPFQPITPGNREDISYVTTGPSFSIPVGSRFLVNSDLYTSNVQYEDQPLDNDSLGAQFALVRQINPTRSIGLNVGGSRTEFDEDAVFEPYERYSAYLHFQSEGSRNEIVVDAGWNISERSGQEIEEPLIGIEWTRQISPLANMAVTGGTRISDSADSFRNSQQDIVDLGAARDQQALSEPFREDYVTLSFTRSTDRSTITTQFEWRDEDIEQLDQFDRQYTRATLDLRRQLGRNWRAGALATFGRRQYDTISREDDDLHLAASLTLTRFRALEIELRLEHIDRDSNENAGDYTENRGYIGFRYTPELGG